MRNNNAKHIFEDNLQEITRLYQIENKKVEEIAKMFKIGISTLRRKMGQKHLLRHVGESSRKYTVNNSFFETIDSERKAYWLGVLYADGCIMHIRNTKYIVFSSIDKEWIESFKNDIEHTGPILSEYHKKYNKFIWKVKITSEKMYSDLMKCGLTEAKSNSICFPSYEIVSEDLMKHFIRGYFDANGSVGLYQNKKDAEWKRFHVSICSGSILFMTPLKSWLESHGVSPIPILTSRKNGNLFSLNLSTFAGLKFRGLIYEDSTIYLNRKHEKMFQANYPKRTFNDYNRTPKNWAKE